MAIVKVMVEVDETVLDLAPALLRLDLNALIVLALKSTGREEDLGEYQEAMQAAQEKFGQGSCAIVFALHEWQKFRDALDCYFKNGGMDDWEKQTQALDQEDFAGFLTTIDPTCGFQRVLANIGGTVGLIADKVVTYKDEDDVASLGLQAFQAIRLGQRIFVLKDAISFMRSYREASCSSRPRQRAVFSFDLYLCGLYCKFSLFEHFVHQPAH